MPVLKMKPTPGGNGGTTVVANPELVGDEPNLEGVEIEGAKYKVPEGGSGGGDDSIFSLAEFANYVNGKVLDVDKTVELFDEVMEEVGYDNYYEINLEFYDFIGGYTFTILGFYNDSSYVLSVCGFQFNLDISSREDLISNKETIESTPINIFEGSSSYFYPIMLQAMFQNYDYGNHTIKQMKVSYERLKSLFKEPASSNE